VLATWGDAWRGVPDLWSHEQDNRIDWFMIFQMAPELL